MSDTAVYYVRSLVLQKEIIDDRGNKSRQAYKPGSKVELTPEEYRKYRALVEPEADHKTDKKKAEGKK